MLDALPEPGRQIIAASWVGTAVFAVAQFLSVLSSALRPVGVVVSLTLFAIGCVAFLVAYARAVERSRTDEIGVGGLYFLSGSSPGPVRLHLLGALGVQTVVALVAASVRPFTAVAFGILVPMFGMGLAGLWASGHGSFPERRRR